MSKLMTETKYYFWYHKVHYCSQCNG